MSDRAIFVGDVIHHSLRATDSGTVYLSVQCRLQNGQGCEAAVYFTDKAKDMALHTLRGMGLPTDPRLLDPRAGADHVSFIGRKVLLERKEKEYRGEHSFSWYLFSGRDSLATPDQIKAARLLAGISL